MTKLFKPLAILALLGFPIAVLGFRLGLYEFGVGFKIMSWTVYLSIAVFFLGMLVTFWKRRSNPEMSKSARVAAYIVMVPIIGLGYQIFNAKSVPSIHNISTDTVSPPQFNKVTELRTQDHNPLDYDVSKLASVQKQAYPNVKTLMTDLSMAEAHAKALGIVNANGWEVVNNDPAAGIIEATETTFIWQFKDDVVIRITEKEGKRAVDLRSVSRIGRSDLGANAKRIEAFLAAFGA